MRRRCGIGLLAGCFLLLTYPVAGQSAAPPLRVLTWNVSWLGHPDYPPADDDRQIAYVSDILVRIEADVVALQEVASEEAFRRLVTSLGPAYTGILSPSGGDQRLGVLVNVGTLRMHLAKEAPLADAAYAFAGRLPLIMHLEVVGARSGSDFLLSNVHLKAFNDVVSYERRLQALARLDAYLSTQSLTPRVLIVGDFNDRYVESTTPERRSPLRLLGEASGAYHVLSAELEASGHYSYCATADCQTGHLLDHVVLGEPLLSWKPNLEVLDTLLQFVPDYASSTSDHLPLLLTLHPPQGDPESQEPIIEAVYPNPARRVVNLELSAGPTVEVEIIDMLGRVVWREDVSRSEVRRSLRVSLNPIRSGTYIVRAKTWAGSTTRSIVRVP